MKIEKFKNSYRVRKMFKGKSYCVYFDHKPTSKEVTLAMAAKLEEATGSSSPESVRSYANAYIDSVRKSGKSPSTIIGYSSILKNSPEWFLQVKLDDMTSDRFQKAIDEYSISRSPKSTVNMSGFYNAVFACFCPEKVFKVKLPKREKKAEYEPSTKDIKALLEYTTGSDYELFLKLSSLGLRRGEVGAITAKDLSDDNILTISKDMIKDENKKYIIKDHPKTSASYRRILIPKDTADLLREKGIAYDGYLDNINKYLTRTLKALDIPHFRLHIMRHFAAAYLVKNGFTKEQIMEYMGWEKGSNVMERVYSYNLDPEDSQKEIADTFNSLF